MRWLSILTIEETFEINEMLNNSGKQDRTLHKTLDWGYGVFINSSK